ncbi:MAG: class I SAM-dependent methyltransferase [Clostridiales bacterium]|nr:class I SAM-dependent methyltransferase [Clostridiales bacterium]
MLFDRISPVYALFFNYQIKYYRKILNRMADVARITPNIEILDFGCGTGALSYALWELGAKVLGVDTSSGMLKQAQKKLGRTGVELIKIAPGQGLPFKDKCFDMVISSFVFHGLMPEERGWAYRELSRVSREKIIIHDYNDKRSLVTDIAEYLESGDYFNFIKVAKKEMEGYFNNATMQNVDKRAAWYILENSSF